jgi:hypothetical protein
VSALTVVYLKATGHVLAALTRAAPPVGDEPVTALVGSSMAVPGVSRTPADVAIPAVLLAAATVDGNQTDVVISPQSFQVVEDPADKSHPKVENVGTPGTDLTLDTASGAKVTLTSSSSPPSLLAVVVLQKVTSPALAATILSPVVISGGPDGTIVADSTGFVTGDTWNMFAFVQGQPPVSISKKLP